MKISNAKITDVSLTMEDYGCLTFYLTLETPNYGCNYGGYSIGHGYLGAEEFSGSEKGLVAMMKIMNVVGVERWEDLKGKYVRFEDNGVGGRIDVIGNIIEEKWFSLKDFFSREEE